MCKKQGTERRHVRRSLSCLVCFLLAGVRFLYGRDGLPKDCYNAARHYLAAAAQAVHHTEVTSGSDVPLEPVIVERLWSDPALGVAHKEQPQLLSYYKSQARETMDRGVRQNSIRAVSPQRSCPQWGLM